MRGAGANKLEADGVYQDAQWDCATIIDPGPWWELTQLDVASVYGTPGTKPISAGRCITSKPGEVATFTTGTQQTYSAGVDLSIKGFGINLSAQDGFAKSAALTYTMGKKGHAICGVSQYPGTPGYVGAIVVH
jgi:hypothetical protein